MICLSRGRWGASAPEPTCYGVAGQSIACDGPLCELAPFAQSCPEPLPLLAGLLPRSGGVRTWHTQGMLGGRQRRIECRAGPQAYDIVPDGIGVVRVSNDGGRVSLVEVQAGATDSELIETLLGPGLILALSFRGTWCLHASAVIRDGAAVAFIGESGAGKSTLASWLAGQAAPWQLLADDVLPVRPAADGATALPRFPQLKRPIDRQPSIGSPEVVPLAAVYLLETTVDQEPAGIRLLGPRQAALALIRHTVASRLFDRTLLRSHLAFCSDLAQRLPIRTLLYPHLPQLLPHIGMLIEDDLSQLHVLQS